MMGSRNFGFTMIELLISISIISIISGVVFFNYPRLNQDVLLNRAAREMTLALREAQSRAVSVTPLEGSSGFPTNFGVALQSGGTEFILFSDGIITENLKYDEGADAIPCGTNNDDECVKIFKYTQGVRIESIKGPSGAAMGQMNVLFYRPDPRMNISNSALSPACVAGYNTAAPANCPLSSPFGPFTIRINQPSGVNPTNYREIEIWRTGQISIIK